jgi:NTP pyrophosphatase (non-canonical NTP hydrolase)
MRAVAEWHRAADPHLPRLDRQALLDLRLKLIEEEFLEVKAELQDGAHPARLAKELADLVFVVYGTAEQLGIPLDRVFALVHEANMRKVDPVTGQVRRRADGKVLKPDGFRDVSIEEIDAVISAEPRNPPAGPGTGARSIHQTGEDVSAPAPSSEDPADPS